MMEGVSREAQMSIAASSMFPGFRFCPTDEELWIAVVWVGMAAMEGNHGSSV